MNRMTDYEVNWSNTPLYLKRLVKPILDEGSDVDCYVLGRSTPLFLATLERDTALVRLLLDWGADVNLRCQGGETPLYAASYKGDHCIVQTLLESGADVNLRCQGGETPLYAASYKGDHCIVQTLLESGADVNLPTDGKGTCLKVACRRGHYEVIKILLENGADLSKFSETDTYLFLAALNVHNGPLNSENYLERTTRDTILENYLERRIDVNLVHKEVELPLNTLHDACAKGHLNDVTHFLDLGVDVNCPSTNGQTPLYIACMNNHFSIVEVLFESGAKPDEERYIPRLFRPLISPLYIAAKKGFTDLVRLLLENGAEVDRVVLRDRQSPLHIACMKGYYDIVQLLLNKGANINKTFSSPILADRFVFIFGHRCTVVFTPLMMALLANHVQVVRLLLERGAQMSQGRFNSLRERAHRPYSEQERNLYNSFSACSVFQNLPDMLMVFYVEGYFDVVLVMLVEMVKLDSTIYGLGAVLSSGGKVFSLRDFAYACKDNLKLNYFGIGKLFKPLKQHLKKLQIIGLFGGTISVDEETEDRYNTEVTSIKGFNVLNDLSLYYAVFQRYKDPYYLRNQDLFESLENYLNSPEALEQFPHYIQILKNTLRSSKYRLTLLTKVSEALKGQEWWDKLPLLPQEYILSHLDMIDLEKISNTRK